MNAIPDAGPTSTGARPAHQVASGGVHVRRAEAALRAAVSAPAPPALLANLRQLMILRGIAIGGQTAAIATAWYLGVSLPFAAMALIVAALVMLNILTWMRLRRPRATSHAEIAAHLGIDLAAICGLLYFSGGIVNPFSLLLVLHVVLMALLLPSLAAAAATTLVAACFVMLGRVHLPFVMSTGDPLPPSIVALGQWLSFALTVAVIAWFLTRIVATLRDYDRQLSEASQRALSDEAVLRVGTLAAGAAHELATPLTTMAVVAGEIARNADSPSMRRDAGVLTSQIKTCREAIANLMAAGGHARAVGGGRERLDRFLDSITARCRTIRPEATIDCDWQRIAPAPEIFADQALKQALLALLNNAVDASPKHVQFSGRRDMDRLHLTITDRGGGLAGGDIDKLGRKFFTTKPPGKGAGLGLVLASRAVERLGGTLRWTNRSGGGTQVDVLLPLEPLSLETEG